MLLRQCVAFRNIASIVYFAFFYWKYWWYFLFNALIKWLNISRCSRFSRCSRCFLSTLTSPIFLHRKYFILEYFWEKYGKYWIFLSSQLPRAWSSSSGHILTLKLETLTALESPLCSRYYPTWKLDSPLYSPRINLVWDWESPCFRSCGWEIFFSGEASAFEYGRGGALTKKCWSFNIFVLNLFGENFAV